MEELRIRPKSDYLHTATWQELYFLTKHWKSDIIFSKFEINFFKGLIDKYFIWITDKDNINEVQHVMNILKHLDNELEFIDKAITKHLNYIRLFIENEFSHDKQEFRIEHIALEDKLAGFTKALRETKREVFAISEKVIVGEKSEHLIDHM